MGLRRRLVKGLLRKYVHNLEDRHIHVDVKKGVVRIDEATLEVAPLVQLLEGLLPAGWEATQAHATEIQLNIPWQQLRQRSTVLTVGALSMMVTQHPCAACGRSGAPCQHWADALARRRTALYEAYAAAKQGSHETSSLVQVITNGLQLNIDSLDIRIQSCQASNASMRVALKLDDVFWGPVDPRLQKLVRFPTSGVYASTSRDFRAGALSLSISDESGMLSRFLQPAQITCHIVWSIPADGQALCPFATSSRVELELSALCIQGNEGRLSAFISLISDVMDSEDLASNQLGPLPWSDAQHETLAVAECSPSRISLAGSDSTATPVASPAQVPAPRALQHAGASEGGQKPRRKQFLRRFMPGQRQSRTAAKVPENETALEDESSAASTSLTMPACIEDDNDSDGNTDALSLEDSASALCGEDGAFLTPMNFGEEDEEEAARALGGAVDALPPDFQDPRGEPGPAMSAPSECLRQSTLTVCLPNLRAGIELPDEGTVELVVQGLDYRLSKRIWLTEAQQTRLTCFGSSFVRAASVPAAERGAGSADGVLFSQHQISIRTLQLDVSPLSVPVESGGVSPGCPLTLIQPLDMREEMVVAIWQGSDGSPCCSAASRDASACSGAAMARPMELVVRCVQVLYVPELWQRLAGLLGPSSPSSSATAEDGEQPEVAAAGAGPATAAPLAKTIVLRKVTVQQATSDDAGLPHQVRIDSAVVENVSRDLKELATVFGLSHSEERGGDGGMALVDMDVEDMDLEQLKAEVQMWRLRNSR